MKLFAAALATLAAVANAHFDNVERLVSQNFDDLVINSGEVWMVAFYPDFCPHCVDADPEFTLARDQLANLGYPVRFGAVDVMANRDLTEKYQITRAPTFKFFGLDKYAPEDYLGQRNAAAFAEFASGYCDTYFPEEEEEPVYEPEPAPVEPVEESCDLSCDRYIYNVDAIVNVVAGAHKQRIAAKEYQLQQDLKMSTEMSNAQIAQIKAGYDEALKNLIAAREQDLNGAIQMGKDALSSIKTDHVRDVALLDQEAIQTIEAIVNANKQGLDLDCFIQGLDAEWFSVQWDHTNRRERYPAPPQYHPYQNPYQHYQQPAVPQYPQYPQQHQHYQQPSNPYHQHQPYQQPAQHYH